MTGLKFVFLAWYSLQEPNPRRQLKSSSNCWISKKLQQAIGDIKKICDDIHKPDTQKWHLDNREEPLLDRAVIPRDHTHSVYSKIIKSTRTFKIAAFRGVHKYIFSRNLMKFPDFPWLSLTKNKFPDFPWLFLTFQKSGNPVLYY